MILPHSRRGALFRRHPYGCSATLPTPFPLGRTATRKVVMGMVERAGAASDREMNASSDWVEWPFGHGAGKTLAHRFLATGEAALRRNTCRKERRAGRAIPRSRRTHREFSCRDRRRQFGGSSAPFSSLGDAEEGRKGKQDKGSVSRPCISDCLHILFLGGSSLGLRDCRASNGGNSLASARNRETPGRGHA